jgi:ParB family chromosome partitioning protein
MKIKGGLGRGLSSLLQEDLISITNENDAQVILKIDLIDPNPNQPRKNIEYDKIIELANSIQEKGLLQPIIVSSTDNGRYKIVAGERRWRACKMIKLDEISVVIKNLSEKEILEIALIENIQRQELTAIEEAECLAKLMEEFDYSQEELAQSISKSRSHVANLLRLTTLPQGIKEQINQGIISMAHGRCLIGQKDAEFIAKEIVNKDLSVRQTEFLVKNWKKNDFAKQDYHFGTKNFEKNDELKNISNILSEKFGCKIFIEGTNSGSGRIIMHYKDFQQLDSILSTLS